MEYAIIGLISFACILLIISFSKKDKIREIENQLEQLSIQLLQESYQLKKRMKILEEELLIETNDGLNKIHSLHGTQKNEREKVFSLYKRGFSYDEIAKETLMTTEEVRIILEHVGMRGFQN